MAQSHSENEEPKTPMWLPAIGVLLFLAVGIWWATRPVEKPPEPPAAEETAAAPGDAGPEAAK
jgi:hypothetical protein